MVASQPVYAVDGDYVIPYTDNYGYVYDPKTGTYIQQSQPTDAIQSDPVQPQNQAANHTAAATPAAATPSPVIQAEQTTTTAPQQTPSISLPVMVAGTIIVLGLVLGAYKFFSKKP